jgi:hypothetical protein
LSSARSIALIDAFGVYADPAKAAALADVPIRRRR